jgi:DNA-binding response OmpR family regulator
VSKVLLCQTPNTLLVDLHSALLQKDHEVVGVLDPLKWGDLSVVADLEPIDVAIIDSSCGIDGTSYCKLFHSSYPHIALVLLIPEGARIDPKCKAVTTGNVLRMPFTPRKVINRINKVAECQLGHVITVGALSLNIDQRCVTRGDIVHRLTPRQARLLEVFMRHTGKTLTRQFLMETVWETNYMGDTRTLDVHVRWIRERIEEDPGSPRYLRTVRGIGYRFGVPGEGE